MADATIVDWSEQEFREVRPGVLGATVASEQLTVTLYRYQPGATWELHSHPEDQLTTVVAGGEITFEAGGTELRLGPGQLALIPGGVPHSARVGGEEVVTLNVHPPRAERAGGATE